jgi:precorrin-2/cobalt-factor-2 C20-methyltransferase
MSEACFYGVGVGPGDPELITVKAHRLIVQADVVVYLVNMAGRSYAREVVQEWLNTAVGEQEELAITMPMHRDRTQANRAYDEAAVAISHRLNLGKTVVYLCEGDPLFFGSYTYLLQRLVEHYPCVTVPGICSVNAASAVSQTPLVHLTDSLAVISARHCDSKILAALHDHNSVVILKVGGAKAHLLDLLKQSGREADAQYIEHATTEQQRLICNVAEVDPQTSVYFSLFLVTRQTGAGIPRDKQ